MRFASVFPPRFASNASRGGILYFWSPLGTLSCYGAIPRAYDFSVAARRQIVRCGALLGRSSYANKVLFLTGTLPGSTAAAMESLSRYSAWVVHELLTHLPRLAGLKSSDCRWVWVWEYQKRGALHWHCILQLPTDRAFKAVASGFRPLWVRVMRGLASKSGVDIAARADGGTWIDNESVWRVEAEPMRKPASRYLSKYLGKTQSKTSDFDFPPSRWYGVGRRLLQEMRDSVVHVVTHNSSKVRHELSAADCEFLNVMEQVSYLKREFSDVVGHGYTWVYYVSCTEVVMDEATRIFGELNKSGIDVTERDPKALLGVYPAMKIVCESRVLFSRYQADLGPYYNKLLAAWMDESPVVEEELFWLEYYARRILFIHGIRYPGQPPERSGAGLPRQDSSKIESPPPPEEPCYFQTFWA